MLVENQLVKVKWNNANKKYYLEKGYTFTKNGDEFEVNIGDLTKGSTSVVLFSCDYCNNEFKRQYKNGIRVKHQYCSNKCQTTHSAEIRRSETPTKPCEQCGKEYKYAKSTEGKTRFCSKECLADWQRINFKGNGSTKYVERITVPCGWCGNELEKRQSDLNNKENVFCNSDCRQEYHRNVLVKSQKFIENNRKNMINNLKNNIPTTLTKPHKKINKLLDKMNIKYTNEYSADFYSIDIHLTEYNLLIEINGTYWHCDNRMYEKINYEVQLNGIINDKKKNSFIKNQLNKNVLYLWEYDIENNLTICESLIKEYIQNKGVLNNYHSFNYKLHNELITTISPLIKPYMEWDINELNNITDFSVKKKRSQKQPDKWVKFNCENCGVETEQLKIQFNRSKRHYCSRECQLESYKKDNELMSCSYCNKDVVVKGHRVEKLRNKEQNNVYCCLECKYKWESENNIGKNNKNYNRVKKECEYCNKEYEVAQNQIGRNKYCSRECKQKGKINRTKMNCLNCDKVIYKTPTDIKKNKTGEFFCSHECSNTYRSKKSREYRISLALH